jgi:hypothetical protein
MGDAAAGETPGASREVNSPLHAATLEQAPAQELKPTPRRPRTGAAAAPSVLIVTTQRWLATARLAFAFAEAGFSVGTLQPGGHALEQVDFTETCTRLDLMAPVRSLRRAIGADLPDLIVPTDDRAAQLLYRLHAEAAGESGATVRSLVERSLGPGPYEGLHARARFAELARENGVACPATLPIDSEADLARALETVGLPAVMKTDGSWSGAGVRFVCDLAEARRTWRRLAAPPSLRGALRRLFGERDAERIGLWAARRGSNVSIQARIDGRPANAAVACWEGEVLASVLVEAVQTDGEIGPATVVRRLDHPGMQRAAQTLVRRLGLSGLCGFDFILDAEGVAHVIELNPRATPTAYLADLTGVDPASALFSKLTGRQPSLVWPAVEGEVIALFPQEMTRDPESEHLRTARHDMPIRNLGLLELGLVHARRNRPRKA